MGHVVATSVFSAVRLGGSGCASSGVTVITAHQDPANDRTLDWDALARLGTTLVILMGAARAESIRDRLIAGGMPASTPVAVVGNATQPNQTEVRTTLSELGRQPVLSPATIIVGDVAALDLRSIVAPITTHEVVPR